jgi:hypothetical protein
MNLRVISSTSAAARLAAAAEFLDTYPAASEVLVVGASRGAADDFVRTVALGRGATFGISRFSLTELAARLAADRLAQVRTVAGTQAGAEAIAARIVFDAQAAGELQYFAPVASLPGFSKAAARTLHELRLAGVTSGRLGAQDRATGDIGLLLARLEAELERASMADRAALLRLAAAIPQRARWVGLPLVLLDVTSDSPAERDFIAALISRAPQTLATIPDGDGRARKAFESLGAVIEVRPDTASPETDLAHLRRYVFTSDQPPIRTPRGDVRLLSAPGEGREATEIVRRVLDEAWRGVPFDEMAVFLRTPQQYFGLLEHACARARVPVYFDRGTRRPDPAGRAFLALLSSAVEGLSAKRFDEYLSLGQVPRLPAGPREPAPPLNEIYAELSPDLEAEDPEAAMPAAPPVDSDDEAIVAGTLRSPWKWEELIVESAVVGGRNRQEGRARWRRRLDGLAADYEYRLHELTRREPDSPRIARLHRDLRNLAHLRQFALPIIDLMAEWPERATWGEWLERFSALAERALERSSRVQSVIADLRPMATVGPITLDEARASLHDRLATLEWDPPSRRHGRLFVGTPHQARGRTFRIAFVPGLAERLVPQRPREDPLLVDEQRRGIDTVLMGQEDRASAERLLLKIALGAANERLYLSYPRMDVAETRARVPSFYALDIMRAITGRVPDHRELAKDAEEEGGAMLAWPAPRDPDRAIDDLEHDLSVLKPLLDARDPRANKGRAHYLLGLNAALRRSVVAQWLRGRSAWSPSDGLIKVSPGTAPALAAQRLDRRAYSLSALQRFATCPYQFLLAAVHRLETREEPEPLLRMDPLTRGSLFHRVQAECYRELQERAALPVTQASVSDATRLLNVVLERVAAEYEDRLAPAIDRVWRDEITELGRDLSIWVRRLADGSEWLPEYFEFSFGLGAGGNQGRDRMPPGPRESEALQALRIDEGRDPRSVPEPVLVDGRFLLRGSVDLIERRTDLDVLRVTDHKTGKNRSHHDLIIDGGKVLQPVLYSVAVEQALGKKVVEGRLFFCTTVGGFADHRIPIGDYARGQGLEALAIVDRAIEQGFLAAAPDARACAWCDFRPVCGPREEERVKRKPKDRLADLEALRSMR